MSTNKIYLPIAFILLLFLVACGDKEESLTVSEVIQNAEALDGKTIRVRGQAYLWIEPSRAAMWMFGGCIPDTDPSHASQGNVEGWLTLYDVIDPADLKNYGAPHDQTGIKISESSFHCNGDYCRLTCSSFEVVSQRTYEFVSVLRIGQESELVLENIDLDRSNQLVDGKWIPIPAGDFDIMFP